MSDTRRLPEPGPPETDITTPDMPVGSGRRGPDHSHVPEHAQSRPALISAIVSVDPVEVAVAATAWSTSEPSAPPRRCRPDRRTRCRAARRSPRRRPCCGSVFAGTPLSPWTELATGAGRCRFAFNLPKIIDQGEDADPLLLAAGDIGLVAVFDGMGGAGGTVYQTADRSAHGGLPRLQGRPRRRAAQHRCDLAAPGHAASTGPLPPPTCTGRSRSALADHSGRAARTAERAAIETVAGLADHDGARRSAPPADAADWTCQLLWAGDSRVYAVTPDSGPISSPATTSATAVTP